jgi:hypothetical protein
LNIIHKNRKRIKAIAPIPAPSGTVLRGLFVQDRCVQPTASRPNLLQ